MLRPLVSQMPSLDISEDQGSYLITEIPFRELLLNDVTLIIKVLNVVIVPPSQMNSRQKINQ
jgi:hypothetical protein